MEIVLVEVTPEKDVLTMELVPPLGLGYIASSIEAKGYHVSVISGVKYNTLDEAYNLIIKEKPEVVGYTATSSARFRAIDLIKRVKKITNAFTIVGGPHFHPTAREALKSVKEIDVVVKGEGEETVPELIDRYSISKDFKNVSGICFRDYDGNVVENPDRPFNKDIDKYPMPAYHLFDFKKYKCTLEGTNLPVIGVLSSRGCPNKCNFCANTALRKASLRLRDPKKFVNEIEYLKNEYGYTSFDFWDDTMTMVKFHITGICNEILNRNLNIMWFARARVNTVNREILKLMKDAGCVAIAYGIESGSEKILKSIKKGINTRQAREAVKISSELGFIVSNYFIVSMPGETLSDINMTFEMIEEFERYPNVNNYHCFAMIYPGTELEKIANSQNLNKFSWYTPYYNIKNKSVGNDPAVPCFEQKELSIEDIKIHILRRMSWPSKIKRGISKIRRIRSLKELRELISLSLRYLLPQLKLSRSILLQKQSHKI